ncbi:hypothetical protein MTP99_006638 [Tenebrio molitor]|nr:hypothetical protein MTP99_006638 [Tenebrio molitor]
MFQQKKALTPDTGASFGSRFCSVFSARSLVTPAESRPTFVHALNVFVSFSPLPSLYKKDCGSVKANWAKRRCSSSRRPAFRETRPNRLLPESLQRADGNTFRKFVN